MANVCIEEIKALAWHNSIRFGIVSQAIQRYLEKCGRQWVSMESIFSFVTT